MVDVVITEETTVVVEPPPEVVVVTVGEAGPRGPQGPAGSSATGAQMNFAFGDATPVAVTTAFAGKAVYSVEVVITEPFDGVGAAITVGDSAVANRLMTAAENDPAVVGSHTTAPAWVYGVDTPVLLTITPGAGASQGKGVIIVSVQT